MKQFLSLKMLFLVAPLLFVSSKASAQEPYAVLSDNNTVLTFYYDSQKAERGGMDVGPFEYSSETYTPNTSWYAQRENITSVIFDNSFATCTSITSTAYWFFNCKNLTTITGISNLKTDNVTNMSSMFFNCSKLTSLDVSRFKTGNVTNMSGMFNSCSSLTSLDLSSFITDNVTNMGVMFQSCSSLTSLDVSSFKTDNVTDMGNMFFGCSSLTKLDVSGFRTDNVTVMRNMFYKCSSLTSLDVSGFETDNVTTMWGMFYGCSNLTNLDVSGFKTDNVTTMWCMFYGCSSLTSLDVSGFNTDNVTDMRGMFIRCSSLKSLDVSGFKTNNVTTMNGMFAECSNLTSLNLSGIKTDNVTDMSVMFTNCTALKSLDLSSFKTDNVTDMNSMFTGCSSLTTLDLSGFKTDKVTNMSSMFQGCSGLTGLDLSGFKTDNITDMHNMFSSCSSLTSIDLSGFKTDNVTDMHDMFYVCSSLTTIYVSDYWSTAKVTNGELMFLNCSSLVGGRGTKYDKNHINAEYARIDKSGSPGYLTGADTGQKLESYALLSKDGLTMTLYYDNQKESRGGIDISNGSESPYQNVTTVIIDASFADYRPTNTAFWFHDCTKLQSITGIEYLHTDDVENMAGMFSRCSSLTSLDVSGFITDNVTNMSSMFFNCSKLTSLDVSRFKTGNVTNMSGMFNSCSSLTSLDLSSFITDNVTNMGVMFQSCSSLTSLDVSSFKTDNVTCMEGMFSGCSSLTSLDLSSFKTDNVTTMWAMFSDCSSLASLDLSSFKTDNVTTMLSMFANCSSLTSLDLSSFKTDNVTSMRAMFQGCSSLSSLNVNSFKTDNMSDMERMFYNCKNLATLDIRNFDTSNAKDMWLMLGGLGTNDNSNNTNIILGEKFNTINNNAGLIFENSTISAITFTGNLPNLSDDTFSGVGTISNPVELVVPSQYAANYSSKMDATGKFYGGYFKMEGISVDTSMPEPNVGTKRLTAITRKQGNNDLERSDMTYDDKGRIVYFVYTKGTRTETVGYTYANDIISVEHSTSGGTNKYEFHFANGKVSYAPITLGSENMTGNRTFEYDSSDQMTKMSIAFDGRTSQQQIRVGWVNGSPTSFSYWRINTSDGTEQELNNSSFTLGNMQTEPVVHAIFGMGKGNNVNIDDDIMELMAFYPFVGKLPERLIEKTIYTDSNGSQTEYNFTYETNSQGNIAKVTVASQSSTTVYTLEWDGYSEEPSFTVGDLKYTNTDGSNVSVAAANTSISGSVQIPSMVRNEGSMYNVTSIAESGFEGCTGISSVTIPASITAIGDKGFYGCSGLTELTVNIAEPISISESVFSGVDKKKCVLNVPENCGDKYREAAGWKEFWLVAAAGETIVDGITYEVESDGSVTIISANHSADGRYEIPSAVIIGGEEHTVTGIASSAFYGCIDMTAVTIPASIKAIGDYAFAGCENLMEVYCESTSPIDLSKAFSRGINKTIRRAVTQFTGVNFDLCKLYVPYGYESLYRDAEGWKEFKNIIGVHGSTDPAVTVTAKNYTRKYGEDNPAFDFDAVGAALDGTPELSCVADKTSDVGSYEIIIKKGSVLNYNDTYVAGTLTVTKAELKVIAANATREQYEENPEFVITYEGWLNGDDESVLTEKPTATTSATKDSEQGEYDIVVSGGQAKNYELVYVKGILKVTESTAIDGILSDGQTYDVYNLQGRKVRNQVTSLDDLPTGVYIVNGRKVVK